MTECLSPELQDLLPDYAADTLDSVSSARVREHLTTCAHCTDDLVVLQMVQQARPRVAVPDIARIVAALPSAPGAATAGFTGPQLVSDAGTAPAPRTPSSMPPGMKPRRPQGTVFGLSVWRLAATLGVVIAGGASVLVARRGIIDVQEPGASAAITPSETSAFIAVAPRGPETLAVATPAAAAHAVSVSYGDLGDYSEAELESMLARLDQWDGATNTEPLPGVPILPNSGGGTP